MTAPNDLREAYTGLTRGPQAGLASCLSNSASRGLLTADGDGLGMPEPNTDRAAEGEALEGLPGSQSVARAAEAARNQGGPDGSRRTNYEGQAGRGVQRQEEGYDARHTGEEGRSGDWPKKVLMGKTEGCMKIAESPKRASRSRPKAGFIIHLRTAAARAVTMRS